MEKDNYFVIVYRILAYLCRCFQEGEWPERSVLGTDAMGINPGYWVNVMESIHSEGYITGIAVITSGNTQGLKLDCPKITMKGMEYLEEDPIMGKVKELLNREQEGESNGSTEY